MSSSVLCVACSLLLLLLLLLFINSPGSTKGQFDYVVQQQRTRHIRLASVVKQAEELQKALLTLDQEQVTRYNPACLRL